jgi:NADPH-dependent glutamate synthase beta subunit-like oxidoreductase/NAD(P)H-flavin reductase
MSLEQHLKARFNLEFADLYSQVGLTKLDQKFSEFLTEKNPNLAQNFFAATKFDSGLAIDAARYFEDFLVELFDVKKENEALKKQHEDLKQIYVARREFVQRHVAKKFADFAEIDGKKILEKTLKFSDIDDLEKQIAAEVLSQKNIEIWEDYTRWALYSPEGKKFHKNGGLFVLPQKIDHQNLVTKSCDQKKRDNFDLTDSGYSLNKIQGEANYCIFCHKQNKDSCRSGIFDKQTAELKNDPLGVELHGCPLDEKISEMNLLKSEGFSLAALAIAAVDNPMIAGTGHRICNDCMKSCIYQKQDPVDIPQIESKTLKDVLALPYGFEIYSLLTRWNPLNFEKKLPQKNSGKKVLVCGLGPSGYTLAHYLLNDGHEVVAIDGLKIEPLNSEISGIDIAGNRTKFKPIKFLDEIYEPLSSRVIGGFGGVAEYGITVRWDKNFLKIIRLLLERRENFRMFGGIRFGSSITDKIAFEKYGFDHVALCIGAGRPNIINIKNNFAKGVRMASDFLMSLQLTGSFKEELFTNLQIRMPALVIGGGLTAVDTACETRAYYQVQIRKFAKKIALLGKEKFLAQLNIEEKKIAEEFLDHAEKLQRGIDDFLDVKILYRKKIQESPAYKLNHQELAKAFEEGIEFIENVAPLEVEIDEFNHVRSLKTTNGNFACKSLLVAAGTTPNLSPTLEDNLDFEIDGKYFAEISENHKHYQITHSARPRQFSVITKIDDESKKAVSFFGDLHPNFEGNVVKAMASAKLGYKQITEILNHQSATVRQAHGDYKLDFLVKIEKIERLSDNVVELFVKAPLLALQTQVGQIFRLQNYHALAQKTDDQLLVMEGVAVTALSIDCESGIISGIVVETGGSTSLIKNFKVGEPCIFMGPSGKPTEIPKNETVVFVGGGRGNQPLTALAREFTKNGCEVIFFAGYRQKSFIVRKERMKESCAQLIIAIEDEVANEVYFQGSVVAAIENYFSKKSPQIDRIFAIGNNYMMQKIAKLRHEIPALQKAKVSITSLNAPMQCMMKGVCSQCLQKRENEKGEVEYFYSCASQDQDSDKIDFQHLNNRCEQNSMSEKVSKMWIQQLNQN